MTDVNTLTDRPDYSVDFATGINDQGVIVGTAHQVPFAGRYAVILRPVVDLDVAPLVTAPRHHPDMALGVGRTD